MSASEVTSAAPERQPLRAALPALWLAWSVLGAMFALALVVVLQRTGGHVIYALDDAYIHMAIAKNVAQHGTWGISPHEFAAASSSPLWTSALAAFYKVFGVQEVTPLVMNLAAAALAVAVLWRVLALSGVSLGQTLVVLIVAIFVTPIVPVAFTGMEHLLHAALSLAFLFAACSALTVAIGSAEWRRASRWALVLAPLLGATRYESLFLIAAVAALALLKRRFTFAAAVTLLGALPVTVAGCVYRAQGWYFLPTSVLLKGNRPSLASPGGLQAFFDVAIGRVNENPHVVAMLVAVAVSAALLGRKLWREPAGLMALAVLVTGGLHCLLAAFGWFYRYEAYLVYLGVATLALLWRRPAEGNLSAEQLSTRRLVLALVLIGVGLAALPRAVRAHTTVAAACGNIHEQQYQLGLLVRRHYNHAAVAANDVGAISFLSDADVLDLWGLGNREVARLKLAGQYDRDQIARLARERGVTIAMVYDPWFIERGGLPASWKRVGQWTIKHNVVCDQPTVSFYWCGGKRRGARD
ncbi:MAG: hypothetical protein JSS27_15395 [Planctomycetes bacterium]|nr:hypothetical protein [Planctomycetota bacterium]